MEPDNGRRNRTLYRLSYEPLHFSLFFNKVFIDCGVFYYIFHALKLLFKQAKVNTKCCLTVRMRRKQNSMEQKHYFVTKGVHHG